MPWPSSSTSAGSVHDWSGSSSHGPSIESPFASTGMSTVKFRLSAASKFGAMSGWDAVDAGVDDADQDLLAPARTCTSRWPSRRSVACPTAGRQAARRSCRSCAPRRRLRRAGTARLGPRFDCIELVGLAGRLGVVRTSPMMRFSAVPSMAGCVGRCGREVGVRRRDRRDSDVGVLADDRPSGGRDRGTASSTDAPST